MLRLSSRRAEAAWRKGGATKDRSFVKPLLPLDRVVGSRAAGLLERSVEDVVCDQLGNCNSLPLAGVYRCLCGRLIASRDEWFRDGRSDWLLGSMACASGGLRGFWTERRAGASKDRPCFLTPRRFAPRANQRLPVLRAVHLSRILVMTGMQSWTCLRFEVPRSHWMRVIPG